MPWTPKQFGAKNLKLNSNQQAVGAKVANDTLSNAPGDEGKAIRIGNFAADRSKHPLGFAADQAAAKKTIGPPATGKRTASASGSKFGKAPFGKSTFGKKPFGNPLGDINFAHAASAPRAMNPASQF
jgi:hypothetical protein